MYAAMHVYHIAMGKLGVYNYGIMQYLHIFHLQTAVYSYWLNFRFIIIMMRLSAFVTS